MNGSEEFFIKKHNTIYTAAKWANAFAWITLIALCLSTVTEIIKADNIFQMNCFATNCDSLFEYLADHPFQWFTYGFSWVIPIIKGFAFFVILKGISFGLNMIVETDLNYREKAMEAEHAE